MEEKPGGLIASYKRVLTFPPFSVLLCTPTLMGFEFPNSEWFCRKNNMLLLGSTPFSFKSVAICPFACKMFMTFLIWTVFLPILSLFLSVCSFFRTYFHFKGVLRKSRVK